MIKAVLFDYDGVITASVKGVAHSPTKQLSLNLEISEDLVKEWFAELWRPLLKGEISESVFWDRIGSNFGKPINPEQKGIFLKGSQLVPLPEMIQLVKEIREDGIKAGILSNVVESTANEVKELGGYDGFDFVILSDEVGLAKPDKEIFDLAMSHLPGIKTNEVIYLDDTDRNTKAAEELGFHVMHVTDQSATPAKLLTLIEQLNR